jgi:hypothetical protein
MMGSEDDDVLTMEPQGLNGGLKYAGMHEAQARQL